MCDKCENDPKTMFADHRHQFIIAYYNMAVADLNRHLGVGWQTLTSVAGAFVLLSLAHEGKLPVPVAVSGAIAVSFWGILNVLDADYWATRAIAFLSNVEAVYFYKDDQKNFNPYAGKHPELKLLDSLKYQLYFAVFTAWISFIYYIYRVSEKTAWFTNVAGKIKNIDISVHFMWLLPLVVFFLLLAYSASARLKRLEDYRDFVRDCPGPGMVNDRNLVRGVLFDTIPPSQLTSGIELQEKVLKALKLRIDEWKFIVKVAWVVCFVALFVGVFSTMTMRD